MDEAKLDLSDDTKRDAFLATEFNALRREIELQVVERRKVEGQTFAGLAAIYSWVLTRNPPLDPFYMKASLAIPMFFAALGLLRWLAIMMRIMAIGAYIQSMEEKIVGEGRGWETILKKMREANPVKSQLEGWVESMTWGLSLIGSTAAFIYSLVYL
ncbi:hypothetical protein [Antarctobacter sp.]|uniref:hypothetical protein n=1 Tax=Antarctobacter sp. TaxID=1872577 RepID=UPI002B272219|nr:hypothetical protein [Antarctobacter sp.]